MNNFIRSIDHYEWQMFDDDARARWTARLQKVGLAIHDVQEILITAKPKAVVVHYDKDGHRHLVADCESRPELQPGDIAPNDPCVYLVSI